MLQIGLGLIALSGALLAEVIKHKAHKESHAMHSLDQFKQEIHTRSATSNKAISKNRDPDTA